MTETKRPTKLLVFAHREEDKGFVFYDLTGADARAKQPRLYTKIKGTHFNPGNVYEVQYNAEESQDGRLVIYPSTFRWVRAWRDADDRREWEARDATVIAAAEARRMEKRAVAEHSVLDKQLDDLRSTYRKLPFNQRPAFIALVVKTLMQGKDA